MKGIATKSITTGICIVALCCLAGGCFSASTKVSYGENGAPPDRKTICQITKGQTTKDVLVSLLGKPASITETPDGSVIVKYEYLQTKESQLHILLSEANDKTKTNHIYYYAFKNGLLDK
ncbi:MAG: hypothetical protein ACYTBZ_22765, partial [Planctomycetota bacterium]